MNRIHLRLLGQSLTAEGVIAVLLAALIALVVVAQLRRGVPVPAPTHPVPHAYPAQATILPTVFPRSLTVPGYGPTLAFAGHMGPVLIGMVVSEPSAYRRIFVTRIFGRAVVLR